MKAAVALLAVAVCLLATARAQEAEAAPCTLDVGLPYESTEALTVTVPEGEVACTAAPISCKDKTYPEGANQNQMEKLCAEPSAAIFQTAVTCTGPHNPADEQCNVDAIQLIYAAAFEAAKAADTFADDKPACVTPAIELASAAKVGKHFDLNGYGLNTMCEVAAESKDMYCYGPSKVDCDKIAVLGANIYAVLDSALGPLNNMPLLEKKFHIQNFLFWSIMGTILTWIGFFMVLYAEIKAILILRERDERERLVAAKIVRENPVKMQELLEQENSYFLVRPYVTILAFILFWVGMLLQFTPMCSFITLIFPFWFGVENACYLVVLAASLFFATSLFLMLLGVMWSCTRGWAALVLLVLGITTNGLVFTGLIGLSIWAFFLVFFLLLWFKILPDYFASKGEKPDWLQDIGAFAVATSLDEIKAAGEGAYKTAEADMRKVPGVAQGMDKAKELKEAAEKAAKDAADAAAKAAKDAQDAAAKAAKDAQSAAGGTKSGAV